MRDLEELLDDDLWQVINQGAKDLIILTDEWKRRKSDDRVARVLGTLGLAEQGARRELAGGVELNPQILDQETYPPVARPPPSETSPDKRTYPTMELPRLKEKEHVETGEEELIGERASPSVVSSSPRT